MKQLTSFKSRNLEPELENISNLRRKNKIDALKHSLAELERKWNKGNLSVEIGSSEASRIVTDSEERKIQEYSLSSNNRRRFMMYVIRAAYDEEPISWKQLIKSLNISRNALQTMIDECVGAGWVIEHEGDKKVDSTFIAAKCLIKTYDNYSAWVRRSCKNVELRTIATAIVELQALIDLEVAEGN